MPNVPYNLCSQGTAGNECYSTEFHKVQTALALIKLFKRNPALGTFRWNRYKILNARFAALL